MTCDLANLDSAPSDQYQFSVATQARAEPKAILYHYVPE